MQKGTKCGSNWGCYCFLFKRKVLPNVTYSPSRRQNGAPTINIQSTLPTAPICVNMFHCTGIWWQRKFIYRLYTVRHVCIPAFFTKH